MRNIALTFLGCFTILAACSNSDDAEKPVTPVPTGDVTIYATTSSLTRDLTRDAVNFSSKDNLAPTSITLNPTEQYQTMDGFGAAITGATFLPILKEILSINPSIKVIAAPWTCPKWMKVKSLTDLTPLDSWTNGQLNPAYYQDYATYFVKWVQAFNAEGIDIYAVTPQNEPLNRGNSASLYMSWEEQRDFVKTALGPKFKTAGLATKIYAYDHNYDYSDIATEKNYPGKMYEDAAASQYLAGAAYHNYGGNREELLNIHKAYPEKELLFTETSIGTWNSGRDLSKRLLEDMKEVALGTINNWCRGVIVWNLMLDNDRAPNREGGCQTCYGAVDISNSDYKTIIRNSHYYIIAHLSSVVKPGAVRIGASGYADSNIMYSAFENPDGTYAFVLMNNNEKTKKITLSDGKRHFAYDVPGKSVTSYRWAKSE